MKKWQFRKNRAGDIPAGWHQKLQISPLMAQILWRRGYNSIQDANQYLNAPLHSLTPPERWPQIPHAAQILAKELLAGRKMAIWGDYDADGVTSTALVLDVLEHHGFNVIHHLPDRTLEGYGLNMPWLEKLAEQNCELLLTVDCGISNNEVIKRAAELGIKVIVSDHHLPGKILPDAAAIVDPRIDSAGNWPSTSLAGVGVAFYLMAAVNNLLAPHTGRRFRMDDALDLVALGTLADVMDLVDENRVLVRAGLKKLEKSSRPGISALKEKCGINPADTLNSEQTVFMLAPRINAAGRMGHPQLALDLLRSADIETARSLALDLNECNQRRKETENIIFESAREQAERLLERTDSPGLVVAGENWHSGIIGIVASRLVEIFNRPAIVLTKDGNNWKGSGRSLQGVDLHDALVECSATLSGFGGHSMAAGLRMSQEKLEDFRDAFNDAIIAQTAGKEIVQIIELDGEIGFDAASRLDFIQELELLEPFGPANPAPVFASPPVRVLNRSQLGSRTDSVKLALKDEASGVILPAKIWRRASEYPASLVGSVIRVAYTPAINNWNGNRNVELAPLDWHRN